MENALRPKVIKKWYMLVLVGTISILLLIAGYLFYSSEEKSIRKDKYLEVQAVAELKISEIEQWLKERIGDANIATQATFFTRQIEQWFGNKKDLSLKKEILKRLARFKRNHGYEDIMLVSPQGEFLLSVNPPEITFDTLTSSSIRKACKKQKITFTDFYYCTIHNKIHFDIIAPIVDEKNIPIAALLFRVDPDDYLYPLLQTWPVPSKTAETILLRKNGDNVLFLNDSRHLKNTALKLKIPLTQIEVPAVKAVLGYKGIAEGKDYRGVQVLSDIQPVPGMPWFMVAKVDKSEIYSELTFKAVFIGICTFVLILLSGAGLAWIYYSHQRNIYRELFGKEKELSETQEEFKTTLLHQLRFSNALNEIANVIVSEEDSAAIIEKTTEVLGETLDVDRCLIYDVNFFKNQLTAYSERLNPGCSDITPTKGVYPIDIFISGITEMKETRHYVTSHFDKIHPALLKDNSDKILHGTMEIKSALWYPFAFYPDGYHLLVLNETHNKREWKSEEIDFLNSVSKQVSIALEKIRMLAERRDAVDQIKANELKFRTVADFTYDWEYWEGVENNFIYMSPSCERVTGYTQNEFISNTSLLEKIVIPEDAELMMKHRQKEYLHEHRNEVNELEFRIRKKDGIIIHLHHICRPIFDSQKNFLGKRVCNRDITEGKRWEKALQESENKYRSLVENQPLGVVIHLPSGEIVYSNMATCKILRARSVDEFVGRNVFDFVYPDFIQSVTTRFQRSLETNEPQPSTEEKLIRIDGSIVDVEINGTPIMYMEEPAIMVIIADITGRKHAEEALRESEERYRLIAENTADTIAVFDMNLNYTYISPSVIKLLGYTPDELIALGLEKVMAPNSWQLIQQTFMEEMEYDASGKADPNRSRIFVTEQYRKDGTKIWVEGITSFVKDKFGKPINILAISRNITERRQVEEELLKSEERFRNLYENAPIGFYRTTPDGKILLANRALVKMLGYSSFKELADRNLAKDGFEPSYERKHFIYQIENEGEIINLEAKWICRNGNVIVARESAKAIRDSDGKILYYDGTVEDITERKRAEEALRQSEERYRTLYEDNPSMYFTVDPAGTVLSVNQYGCEQLGYTAPELVGQSVLKVFHDEDKESALQYVAHCVKNLGQVFHWELRKVCPTGSVMWVKESARAIQETDGQIVIYIVCENINERKHTEEEIISQKNRFAQLFENSPIAIALLDDKDKFIHINKSFSALFGYAFEEIGDRAINDLIVSPEFKEEAKTCSDEAHSGTQISKDSYRRRKDGTLVYVHILAVPVIVNNKIVGLYGMYVDLSERKKAEEELINAKEKAEEMSRLKSNFLANMSHELRTPLNGILGYATILSSSIENPEFADMSQTIYTSGKRLSETLNLILDLSKAETEKIEIVGQNINVVSEVKSIVNSFTADAAKKDLQLEPIVGCEVSFALLDENLFKRAISNLIANAIKFTENGKITVEVGKELTQQNDLIFIKVKDTGIGIPEDKIDLIWEEFRQVSEGMGRSFEGTGLGLTLSKRIIELMNGSITVESKVGVGSTFTVKFPSLDYTLKLDEVLPPKQETFQTLKESKKGKAAPKVALYVEDDFINQNVVQLYLKEVCKVETAKDGSTALKLATEKEYDLFLMDINLGVGMDGMAVTKELRKMKQYSSTPIVAVTAYAMENDKKEFLSGGCSHYISKPFDKNELIQLISTIVASGKY
ncbi:MAG: PAS domain S-box protein [Ignavibacteria bacterium]|nr:PAS domain S-box protein [Ignavibacteria bacterium]